MPDASARGWDRPGGGPDDSAHEPRGVLPLSPDAAALILAAPDGALPERPARRGTWQTMAQKSRASTTSKSSASTTSAKAVAATATVSGKGATAKATSTTKKATPAKKTAPVKKAAPA